MKKENFYYTFGSSSSQPHMYGHVRVTAKNRQEADKKFTKKYGWSKYGDDVIRCSSIYDEKTFKPKRKEYKSMRKCHAKIK